jgi:hypothetical protein
VRVCVCVCVGGGTNTQFLHPLLASLLATPTTDHTHSETAKTAYVITQRHVLQCQTRNTAAAVASPQDPRCNTTAFYFALFFYQHAQPGQCVFYSRREKRKQKTSTKTGYMHRHRDPERREKSRDHIRRQQAHNLLAMGLGSASTQYIWF